MPLWDTTGTFDFFFAERDPAKRIEFVNKLVAERTADGVFAALFAAVNVAVDHLWAVLEVVETDTDLTLVALASRVDPRLAERAACYRNFQFDSIVAGLNAEPANQSELSRAPRATTN